MMATAGLVFSAATGGKVSSVLLVAIPVLLTVLTIIMVLASRYSIRLRKKAGSNQSAVSGISGRASVLFVPLTSRKPKVTALRMPIVTMP